MPVSFHSALRQIFLALSCLAVLATCALSGGRGEPAAVPEIWPGYLQGYLPAEALPDSLALLPPPPATGSLALAHDEEINRIALALRNSPRWNLAIEDANLTFPRAAGAFSCALNAPITEEQTPQLYMLLRRSLSDAARATHGAKSHYWRPRPFMVNEQPTCTPDDEEVLRTNGSYPSGHTAIGWVWALILSELAPERSDAILSRGRAFGRSRVICNVHWQSDVIEGRFLGSAVVARLHSKPAFLAAMKAAGAELADVRSRDLPPVRDCVAEAEALAANPPGAP